MILPSFLVGRRRWTIIDLDVKEKNIASALMCIVHCRKFKQSGVERWNPIMNSQQKTFCCIWQYLFFYYKEGFFCKNTIIMLSPAVGYDWSSTSGQLTQGRDDWEKKSFKHPIWCDNWKLQKKFYPKAASGLLML